jgi:hypothetical protein
MATSTPVASAVRHQPLEPLHYAGPPPQTVPPIDWTALLARHDGTKPVKPTAAADGTMAAAPAAKQKHGFFSSVAKSLTKSVDGAVHHVQGKVETTAESYNTQRDATDFLAAFPKVAHAGSRLLSAYSCSIMHKGEALPCTLYLCTMGLCVAADSGLVKDFIPMHHIASWLPAVALTTEHAATPFIMPVPHSAVLPDALELFTTDGQIVQIMGVRTRGLPLPSQSRSFGLLRFIAEFEPVWASRVGSRPSSPTAAPLKRLVAGSPK